MSHNPPLEKSIAFFVKHIGGRFHSSKYVRLFGYFSILVCIVTWSLELRGVVFSCPYCQVQRTAIGLVGLLMVIGSHSLISRYLILLIGFFGAHVAATQLFNNFNKKAFNEEFIYLSACALIILIAQMMVVFGNKKNG
jgi:hypothetical protein